MTSPLPEAATAAEATPAKAAASKGTQPKITDGAAGNVRDILKLLRGTITSGEKLEAADQLWDKMESVYGRALQGYHDNVQEKLKEADSLRAKTTRLTMTQSLLKEDLHKSAVEANALKTLISNRDRDLKELRQSVQSLKMEKESLLAKYDIIVKDLEHSRAENKTAAEQLEKTKKESQAALIQKETLLETAKDAERKLSAEVQELKVKNKNQFDNYRLLSAEYGKLVEDKNGQKAAIKMLNEANAVLKAKVSSLENLEKENQRLVAEAKGQRDENKSVLSAKKHLEDEVAALKEDLKLTSLERDAGVLKVARLEEDVKQHKALLAKHKEELKEFKALLDKHKEKGEEHKALLPKHEDQANGTPVSSDVARLRSQLDVANKERHLALTKADEWKRLGNLAYVQYHEKEAELIELKKSSEARVAKLEAKIAELEAEYAKVNKEGTQVATNDEGHWKKQYDQVVKDALAGKFRHMGPPTA